MKTSLTIAGSDSSGGAGIQADLKTFFAHGVYGMSAVTALTAQNTRGVSKIMNVPPEMVRAQMAAVFEDIFPDSVKIGMVSTEENICCIAETLAFYKAQNIVVDPVMLSTSGHRLLEDGAQHALIGRLLPAAVLITPNIPEAELLCGFSIRSKEDMLLAARRISGAFSGGILIKGGHLQGEHDDLLYWQDTPCWQKGKHIDNPNTHGTGCTLSSAIAANLAKGENLINAVKNAKKYIEAAIGAMLNLGSGRGPLDHMVFPTEKRHECS